MPVIRLTSPAPYKGTSNFLTAWRDALKEAAEKNLNRPLSAPQAIMIAPARKFSCLSMPSCLNFGTVKPHWHQRVVGCGDNVILNLHRCAARGERVKAQQRQGDAGQRYAQAD